MKPLKILALLLVTANMAFCQSADLNLKKHNNLLFQYGRTAAVTTTDATPTTLSAITVAADEGGLYEVQLVGYSDTDTSIVTGSKIVRYAKKAGTLTLGTPAAILATAADSGISGATWTISASSNNIIVQVTGVASKTIRWRAVIRKLVVKPS
jgi:hypothetical protein